MKTSIIRQRVADFLQRQTPFDAISTEDLLALAGSGKVKFHESEEYLFRRGDPPGPFVWVIQQGRVELLDEVEGEERLRDVLGEGDVLALDRFTGSGACGCAARTATDVILYGVAAELFSETVTRYPAVERFLAAHNSAAGVHGFNRTSWLDVAGPPLGFLLARLVTVPAGATAEQSAAARARSRNGAAALVDASGRAVGLVGGACPPVVAPDYTTREAVRAMLRARSEQVLVAEDGVPQGILTGAELAMFCGFDAAGLVGAIRRAESAAEIEPLMKQADRLVVEGLAQPRDVDDCCRISAKLAAATAEACVRMAERNVAASGIAAARVPYCLVLFGTSARGDLLGAALPTVAAVYDDADDALRPEDQLYFLVLAGELATQMHACGAEGPALDWPPGAQPSMPLSEWKRLFTETIRNPVMNDLFSRREFFDISQLTGDEAIFRKLRDFVVAELQEEGPAVALLANDTMGHVPPLTFFRGLVLDIDGAQRDSFDIELTIVGPLTDAARVFALAKRSLAPANTLERFAAVALEYPDGAAVIREAAEAFRIGLYYQALAGSSTITPGELGKFDQLLLKTAFSGIQRFLEYTLARFVEAG
ncbi:MAG TPA: putative nucleotidyltransferase substrate binding domain-containing protein [Paludibaculum sp.]|jgi:CBS domain-containing protein